MPLLFDDVVDETDTDAAVPVVPLLALGCGAFRDLAIDACIVSMPARTSVCIVSSMCFSSACHAVDVSCIDLRRPKMTFLSSAARTTF